MSANIEFLFSQEDSVETDRQEAFHAWVVNQLRIVPVRRLQYRKYRDRAHMQRVTGQLTNGWADPPAWTAHSIWTWDAHEAVHVYTAVIGRPSDFFNEGIAVALSADPSTRRFVSLWNNTPIDDIARSLHRARALPAILTIVETEAFRRLPDQTSYPAAGSFVSYVLRTSGMDAIQTFFRSSSRADTQADIASRFSEAFGRSLSDAEAGWRTFLGGSPAVAGDSASGHACSFDVCARRRARRSAERQNSAVLHVAGPVMVDTRSERPFSIVCVSLAAAVIGA